MIRKIAAGMNDAYLFCIEGELLVTKDPRYFHDPIHPNDAGFAKIASSLCKLIQFLWAM